MMNDKSKQMIEIVKDIKANIPKIPTSAQQDFENTILHLSKGLNEKKSLRIGSIDRKFINNLKITKDFLTKNKDLMCTNVDKGNTTYREKVGIHKGHGEYNEARCSGIIRISKENYSLRLVISTINNPTTFLEQNSNILIKIRYQSQIILLKIVGNFKII